MTRPPARLLAAVAAALAGAALVGMPGSSAATSPVAVPPTLVPGVPGARVLDPAPASRTALATVAPSLRRARADLGAAAAGDRVTALVELPLRDRAGLAGLIGRVSDPSSPQYGHYVSPTQFRAAYSPTPASVTAIEAWLRAAGLQVTYVPADRLWLAVTGTVAQADAAFATRIDRLALPGGDVDAPVQTASAPVALRGLVAGVRGLDGGDVARSANTQPPPAYVSPPPCSSYWGQQTATGTPGALGQSTPFPYAPCGYTPQQLEQAYGIAPALQAGIDGRGVRVAIIDPFDNPRMPSDVQTYSARHGLPAPDLVRYTDPVASDTPELPGGVVDPDNASEEEALDVEAAHSMAPGATIVYEAADSQANISLEAAQTDVVDNHLAQIVSNSYGSSGDSSDPTEDSIFMQAASEGIGFYFASGDAGDETMDPNGPGDREVDAPANSPYVTAVGGTSLGVGPSGQYEFETYWGNYSQTLAGGQWTPGAPGTYYGGGGGGTSQAYAEPAYQNGVVPASLAGYWQGKPAEAGVSGTVYVPGRVVPDVAMLADPNTGMIVGDTQDFSSYANPGGEALPSDDVHYGEFRIGGTSLACPLFAGMMALADQAAGKAHGFANPALYSAFSAHSGAFHDPHRPSSAALADVRVDYTNNVNASGGTSTVLRSFDQLLTLHELPGYDDSTGLGTPDGITFLRALAPGSAQLAGLATSSSPAPAGKATPPRACHPARLTFHLRAPAHQRVVRVVATINGRRVAARRGRRLRTLTLRLPRSGRLRIHVTATSNRGHQRSTTRVLAACTAAAPGKHRRLR